MNMGGRASRDCLRSHLVRKKVSHETPGIRKKATRGSGAGGGLKGTCGLFHSDRTDLTAQLCLHRLNDSARTSCTSAYSKAKEAGSRSLGDADEAYLEVRLHMRARRSHPGVVSLALYNDLPVHDRASHRFHTAESRSMSPPTKKQQGDTA